MRLDQDRYRYTFRSRSYPTGLCVPSLWPLSIYVSISYLFSIYVSIFVSSTGSVVNSIKEVTTYHASKRISAHFYEVDCMNAVPGKRTEFSALNLKDCVERFRNDVSHWIMCATTMAIIDIRFDLLFIFDIRFDLCVINRKRSELFFFMIKEVTTYHACHIDRHSNFT